MKKKFVPVLSILLFCLMAFTPPKTNPVVEQKVEITTRYGKIILKLYNETPLHRDNFIKLVKEGFYDSLLFHRIVPTFMIQGGDPTSKHAAPGKLVGEGENGYRIPAEFNKNLYHKRGALGAARDNNPEKASSGCQFYIIQGRIFEGKELTDYENSTNLNAKRKLFGKMVQSDSVKVKLDDYVLRGDKDGMRAYMLSLQDVIDKLYAPLEFRFSKKQMFDYLTIGGAPHLDENYTVFGEVLSGLNVVDSIASQKTDSLNRPLVDLRMKMRLIK